MFFMGLDCKSIYCINEKK